jgi:hypothetical protein
MKNLNPSFNVPHGDWQTLGEYRQPVEAGMDAKIRAWLLEILHALPLHTDFRNSVLQSAQDSARHAFQAGTVMKVEHIHLRVFGPRGEALHEKAWGFFRIEKIGAPTVITNRDNHSIEFYLYLED